jgi:putative FmdB family regulatory protein
MPIYDHRCEECDEDLKLFVRSHSQQADPTCPKWGSRKVKRTISRFGLGKASANTTLGASCDNRST